MPLFMRTSDGAHMSRTTARRCGAHAASARCATPRLAADDRIYADLAQARAELEFTYRNNLDLR